MLTVLLVSVASTVASRVSMTAQIYDQIAQTAGDAGLAYAKACLDANGGVPLWGDGAAGLAGGPLMPSTDCTGKTLTGLDCTEYPTDSRCAVTVNGGATAQVLVVGGGGGGASGNANNRAGGGGGAGGLKNSVISITAINYNVVVGGAGAGGARTGTSTIGTAGFGSSFSSLSSYVNISTSGGGYGGRASDTSPQNAGSGGSGGGGGDGTSAISPGGTGVSGEGYAGGNGGAGAGTGASGGSGGGALGPGISGAIGSNTRNPGGTGFTSSISGASVTYAKGGTGGPYSNATAGENGANYGDGGGGGAGSGNPAGGNGGSGIVIISYLNDSITALGCNSSVRGAVNTVCTFTVNGTFAVSAISVNGSPEISTFSVGRPTIINGKANEINSIGSTKLLKSDSTVWRTYSQSSRLTIPTISTSTFDPIYGNGADGAITVAAGKNINTDIIATGRTCADAVNYSITTLAANIATLSTTPAAGCLVAGDEILLINLQGISTNYANVGNYETLRVLSVSTNVITFVANKTKYYGNGATDDLNIGTAVTNQRVMLQRVPNYTNVTINSAITLTAGMWDGTKSGVLAFRANGALTNNGIISMNSNGYIGAPAETTAWLVGFNGGSYVYGSFNGITNWYGGGGGGQYHYGVSGCGGAGGGGGGYGTIGTSGSTGACSSVGGTGGAVYGVTNMTKIFPGSGGGGSGDYHVGLSPVSGGKGGGVIILTFNAFAGTGSISTAGSVGGSGGDGGGGGGSGGSVFLGGETVSLSGQTVSASGGNGGTTSYGGAGGAGGAGRIGIYSPNAISGTTSPTYTTLASWYF